MTKQRKVSTRSSTSRAKQEKILEALRLHPEGATPKIIAAKSGLNVNTVKSLLPELKQVKRVTRGWYKILDGGDGTLPNEASLFDWNFHNCILSIEGDYSDLSYDFRWGSLYVRIQGSASQATLRLASDWPLNVASLSFVAGFFSELCGAPFSSVVVSSIELNKDFRDLRLDGLNSLSINSLIEQFKVYQKKNALRVEHKTAVPFRAENIIDMLSQNPMSVDFNERIASLADSLRYQAGIIRDLTDEVRKLRNG